MEPAELREAMEKKNKTTERNESQIRIRKKKSADVAKTMGRNREEKQRKI